ncbi:uncharacterized protein B0P05DRAFT_635531 [Gilbertella persicaria]|uniref:uncharacterized protein n=1 Tax=Gilbertella persicaria TaxID=101096 RepID=UPI00221F2D39|nr:uncharacterized protein B0P05DRAFT_635531 [Gilbertella persicaria]KAI8086822.1 hypothetical protein B0P05DRAFT_635531 [Gilbertella persicaria]
MQGDATSTLDSKGIRPKRIVFCIDSSSEMLTLLRASLNAGKKDTNLYYSTRLETLQRFLKRFLKTNTLIENTKDEYALMLLTTKAKWLVNFTNDINTIYRAIDSLDQSVTEHYDRLDTQSIFDTLSMHIDIDDDIYFTQVILVYNRDSIVPEPAHDYQHIRDSPNFVLDVLFLHDRKLSESMQSVYDFWSSLDSDIVPGWYYEAGLWQGKDDLAKALSQLLSHPHQRREQEDIDKEIVYY